MRSSIRSSLALVVITVGELLVVSMIDELKELFVGPRGGVLGTKIVEHQQIGIPDLLETFVVRDATLWIECGSKLIEQIGHNAEVDRGLGIAGPIGICDRGG